MKTSAERILSLLATPSRSSVSILPLSPPRAIFTWPPRWASHPRETDPTTEQPSKKERNSFPLDCLIWLALCPNDLQTLAHRRTGEKCETAPRRAADVAFLHSSFSLLRWLGSLRSHSQADHSSKEKRVSFPTVSQPDQFLSLDYRVTWGRLLPPAVLLPKKFVASAILQMQSLFPTALLPLSLPKKLKSHFSGGIEGRGRSAGLPGAG